MRKTKEYALYRGDELLIIDTLDEIAKQQGVDKRTLSYYGSPAYLKRQAKSKKGNYKVLVKIEDD